MKLYTTFLFAVLGVLFFLGGSEELPMKNANLKKVVLVDDEVVCTCDRETDSLVLIDFYNSMNGPNWLCGWDYENEPMDACEMFSLNDEGCVRKIDVAGSCYNGFQGSLPSNIGGLTNLDTLIIKGDFEDFEGPIPQSIGNLVNLKVLQLYGHFTGEIPATIGNLSNLKSINIWNDSLSGSVPVEFFNINSLEEYSIRCPNLNGIIPNEIGNLTELQTIYIWFTPLYDSLPSTLINCQNLKSITIQNCSVIGSLPNTIGELCNLETLRLNGNLLLGEIPSSIGDLTNLKTLSLNNNFLTGSLPNSIGALSNLNLLNLTNNSLDGIIPSEIGGLGAIDYIGLSDNNFVGTVPESIEQLNNLYNLYLSGNQFTKIPDLTTLPQLTHFHVYNNQLSFDDLLPYQNLNYQLFEQDTFTNDTVLSGEYGDELIIDLGFDEDISSNEYTWFKDGDSITTIYGENKLVINSLSPDDSGQYFCKITNDSFPSTLIYTLNSQTITVEVNTPALIADSLELVEFYYATDGPNWIINWNLEDSVNSWAGVTLNSDKRVLYLEISWENNLNGEFIDLQLPKLKKLVITNNESLTGSIIDFSGLPELYELNLRRNNLSGNLPNFSNLYHLKWLYISWNHLNGNLPGFDNCPNLQLISLIDNEFDGNIPDFQLPDLYSLDLRFNFLDSLPNFSGLPELYNFYASNNQIHGTLPNFENCPELRTLNLSNNLFSGSIPYFTSENFEGIYLSENNLSGEVPDFSSNSSLSVFEVSNNNLKGEVKLFVHEFISSVLLNGNHFTKIPNFSLVTNWSNGTNKGLKIFNNELSFDDIIPNMVAGDYGTWEYAPQDSFFNQLEIFISSGNTYIINLDIDQNITNNSYKWFKNGDSLTTLNDNFLELDDLNEISVDTFHCQVSNPQVPDLTLNSRAIIIHVCEPLETTISETLCDGESLTVNGTVYDQVRSEGTEYIDVPNEQGCDSILYVQLDFYPKSEKIVTDTISEGSTIEVAGTIYDSTGVYETILVGQAHTGCDSIIRLELTVVPQDIILGQDFPNAITPNDDGLNDRFVIPALRSQPENFLENEFLIFSRSSQVLYQSKPYNNNWDGRTTDGQELPTGTYYYIFRYKNNGSEVIKKGKILLMR